MKKVVLRVVKVFILVIGMIFWWIVMWRRLRRRLTFLSESRGLITRLLEIKYTTELYASTRGKNDAECI
jgi:cytochrome c-type biogenesis protein CcmH/NrfF